MTAVNSKPFEVQTDHEWAARRKTLTANPKENHE